MEIPTFDVLLKQETINLAGKGVHDGNIDVIARVLGDERSVVKTLYLYGNTITLSDGKFTNALKHNSTLETLYIQNNSIGIEGAKRLADALKYNKTLKVLKLSENKKIGIEGFRVLVDALKHNVSLQEIHINKSNLGGDMCAKILADALPSIKLQKIYIRDNDIGEEGIKMLAGVLEQNLVTIQVLSTGPLDYQLQQKGGSNSRRDTDTSKYSDTNKGVTSGGGRKVGTESRKKDTDTLKRKEAGKKENQQQRRKKKKTTSFEQGDFIASGGGSKVGTGLRPKRKAFTNACDVIQCAMAEEDDTPPNKEEEEYVDAFEIGQRTEARYGVASAKSPCSITDNITTLGSTKATSSPTVFISADALEVLKFQVSEEQRLNETDDTVDVVSIEGFLHHWLVELNRCNENSTPKPIFDNKMTKDLARFHQEATARYGQLTFTQRAIYSAISKEYFKSSTTNDASKKKKGKNTHFSSWQVLQFQITEEHRLETLFNTVEGFLYHWLIELNGCDGNSTPAPIFVKHKRKHRKTKTTASNGLEGHTQLAKARYQQLTFAQKALYRVIGKEYFRKNTETIVSSTDATEKVEEIHQDTDKVMMQDTASDNNDTSSNKNRSSSASVSAIGIGMKPTPEQHKQMMAVDQNAKISSSSAIRYESISDQKTTADDGLVIRIPSQPRSGGSSGSTVSNEKLPPTAKSPSSVTDNIGIGSDTSHQDLVPPHNVVHNTTSVSFRGCGSSTAGRQTPRLGGQNHSASSGIDSEKDAQILALQGELTKVSQQLEDRKSSVAKVKPLVAERNTLLEHASSSGAELKKAKATIQALENGKAETAKEIRKAKSQVTTLSGDVEALTMERNESVQALKTCRDEQNKLTKQVDTSKKETEQLRQEIASVKEELELVTEEKDRALDDVKKLKDQYQSSMEELERTKGEFEKEKSKHTKQSDELTTKVSTLESNLKKKSDELKRLKALRSSLKNGSKLPDELQGLDKELIEKINSEIVDSGEEVKFDDIAGLNRAKDTVHEMVIMPMQRPDLFTGLREQPKGLLLFGPPGTGKTLIAKAIAHESGATFFSISSSSLNSKWVGEGEKLVRTLFAVARYHAPSVVFIDEVDSMLTQRKADEDGADRKMKTEFLVQTDPAGNEREGRVLLIGATNRPMDLDDAARRRFVKRLYIPLPDQAAREALMRNLLDKNKNNLSEEEITKLSHATEGYSGADLKALCSDAAMGPIRDLGKKALKVRESNVKPITYKHFKSSLQSMNPSVAKSDLVDYIEWNNAYGNNK